MPANNFRLPDEQLYRHVNAAELPFSTSKDVKPCDCVFGNDTAKDALTFAIECHSPGLNAYVRGLSGSGRKTLVRQVLKDTKPQNRQQRDFCFVHNFNHPNQPRLLILPRGYGSLLKQMMLAFTDFVANDLPKTFNGDTIRNDRKAVEQKTNNAVAKCYAPFEAKLKKLDLVLANIKDGENTRMLITPLHEGQPLSPEAFNDMVAKGEISAERLAAIQQAMPALQQELQTVAAQANTIIESSFADIRQVDIDFAKQQLNGHLDPISKKFANSYLDAYLTELVDDFVNNNLYGQNQDFDPMSLYGVNILSPKRETDAAPVVFEQAPTLSSLVGAVETEGKLPPYQSVSAGALIKADGGFLLIEVDDALAESGVWITLIRTLRAGKLSFAFEDKISDRPALVKPDAIPLDVKVILVGSHRRFYELNAYDADFAEQFKVLADLDTELSHHAESYLQYANVIRKIVDDENLPHFSNHAVARLIEHGARLAGGRQRLSARFGRLMDTAREAAYLANKEAAKLVTDDHIVAAIRANKQRSFAPAKRFYQLLESGTIIIDTEACAVGQINGLAVTQAGTISYGFPARITATVAPGQAGLINIEGKADLSGQIHTKGFQILGGVLRHLLHPPHPLSFTASIAFEQSYGGIDGDSASGAEACCLLSALTNIPIKQSLAMTGAIDQFGNIQAIGGVNEKIEGFFDACRFNGLNGEQGVIIPHANIDELMLRDDVVAACKKQQFHIYAVNHVLDALAILTATSSCKAALTAALPYPDGSVLAIAEQRVTALFEQSRQAGV